MLYLQKFPILIPFIAILSAEITKALIDFLTNRSEIRFLSTGGMPSGHSAFVSALVVVVAYREGVESTMFMISSVLALIVMYDAIHLRGEVGFHAKLLNKKDPKAHLEESLGHTNLEVLAGAFFGSVVAFLCLSF